MTENSGNRRQEEQSEALLTLIAKFDAAAMRLSVRLRHKYVTRLMLALTLSGSGLVWFPSAGLVIYLYITRHARIPELEGFLAGMTAAFLALLTGQALKRIFKRKRPYDTLPGHQAVGLRPSDFSMPSTHTATTMALFTRLLASGHPWFCYAGPWALLVTFSRYYLGYHYPTDIIMGALLGMAFGLVDWAFMLQALFL